MSDDAHWAEAHDEVVRVVAATRFPFPDQQDWPPTYVTLTNDTTAQRGIPGPDGAEIFPDIVIVDSATDLVAEVGEVETDVQAEYVPRWQAAAEASRPHPISEMRHFFLYVPVGQEERARDLLAAAHVPYGGVRTWERGADGSVRIVPFVTPVDQKDHR